MTVIPYASELSIDLDAALVGRLVAGQFPDWARRRVTPVPSSGTDNAIFRLGDDLAVRLPRRAAAAALVEREQLWLPRLAPHLPLATPTPVAEGSPAERYPWRWSICPWLPGEDAASARVGDLGRAAEVLGRFLVALRGIDASEGPPAGPENHGRGAPLDRLDRRVRADIVALAGDIDGRAALEVWEQSLAASAWEGPGTWLHGDLHAGNLLVRGDALVGILDFGLMGVGDPACDLMVAWSLLDKCGRRIFRDAVEADAAMWARGRGWAVYGAVIALAFYRDSNSVLSAISHGVLARTAED